MLIDGNVSSIIAVLFEGAPENVREAAKEIRMLNSTTILVAPASNDHEENMSVLDEFMTANRELFDGLSVTAGSRPTECACGA